MYPSQNTLFDLPNTRLLTLHGEQSADFLQGQLSCDVHQVNAEHMRPSAHCNLKGRVLALPDVVAWHGLHLVLPQNLIEKTQKSLMKTALLSRVSLQVTPDYHVFGFYRQDAKQPLPFEGAWPTEKHAVLATENACAYHLGDGFYHVLANQTALDAIEEPLKKNQQDANTWHALRLAQGDVQIYPESRGLFLPHRLGLHESGHLNFNKGCYKGQEIIARTHYRAKIKHTLKCFTLASPQQTLHPGLRLMNEDGTREIGELVDFCQLKNNQTLIAVSLLIEHPDTVYLEDTSTTDTPLTALSLI